MTLAIIADIHSNLQALERAMEEIDARGVDAIYCLGDIVGYGADPAPCLEIVQARCRGVVRGNHDEAAASGDGLKMLPKDGQKAVKRNREQLSDEQLGYLGELPLLLEADGCTFAHASPHAPENWSRLLSYGEAREQFDHFETEVCFIGHTHLPAVMSDKIGVLRVRKGRRYLINVGSVGQPRDGNPRLGFGIFDTESFSLEQVRLPYDVEGAMKRIREEELPDTLARRLAKGR